MDIALKVFNQVAVIFILIAIGFACMKLKWINKDGVSQLTNILLSIVTPCVLIQSYQAKVYTPALATGLLWGALFSVISILASTLLSQLIFRKEPTNRYRINRFAAVYSNCGFMAIPLLQAVLGADGVFYGSSYLAMFTLLYWTVGVYVFTEDIRSLSLKNVVLNIGVIATVVSITLFMTEIKLPSLVMQPIAFMAGLNTPLAMIILGSYLAGVKFKEIIKNGSLYIVSFLRLLVYPLLSLGICMLLKLDTGVAQAIMISSACPTAAVTTLFAVRFKLDAEYSAQIVSATTLLSIITIPIVMLIMGYVY
ncbi:MAG: AEC family transporter [Clostridia bacterium]|nr:AEC family transporter [Clostridia bacterium]